MPVDPATLGAFALAAAAIVLSPGPDTLLILRYALMSGRPAGYAAVAGVQIGLIAHTTLAAAGVSALIASSPLLFKGLAIAGAAYLAWLGLLSFRSSTLAVVHSPPAAPAAPPFHAALICNVLNPKVIVLFLALYPNFLMIERGDVAVQIAVLSAVLIVINSLWQLGLVWSADVARQWIVRPRVRRIVGYVTGAILILFALGLLWQHAAP